MLNEPILSFSLVKAPLYGTRFPQFRDTVLPVADLAVAVAFYGPVFGLERIDARGRNDFALLGRDYARLSLYAIPGYTPPDALEPVLSCTLPPTDFHALTTRIRTGGGAVALEPDYADTVPRVLFTDPGGCNLLEVRGILSLAPAHAA